MIRIVTDSTCDLPPEIIRDLNITVVPCFVNFGNVSYRDGIDISRREFYERLVISPEIPTTSAPNVATFAKVYQHLASEGADGIISIHLSASLASTVNTAQLAAEAIQSVPVKVINSCQLSLGLGFLVISAAQMAAIGHQMNEIIDSVKEMITRVYSFAVVDTLDYLRRSGRISHLKYQLATLLDIKPVVRIYNGVVNMDMTRTTRKAFSKIVDFIKDLEPLEYISIVHTNTKDKAGQLFEIVHQFLPDKKLFNTTEACPAIGVHMGPNTVGLVCVAQKSI